MKLVIPFLAILGMCVISEVNLNAATLVVSEATDAALRNAVANAAPGDVITFDPALFVNGPVDISLNGAILIEKDLTIAGPVGKGLSIKGGQKEIFVIGAPSQNCHVLLRNMKLWDGAAQGKNGEMQCTGGGGGAGLGGAIYVNFAILICQNVVFEKNSAIGGDGAISGLANAVNGGRGGNACNDYLIYQTSAGEYVRGNNLGGLGGDVNSIVHTGSPGGYACGGGGGVGERLFQNNAASGGAGGWAGGGGGGGGGGSTYKTGGAGGEFGGNGGAGDLSSHGGGGGGAGLGGAIFVDSNGGLVLENCVFRGNLAKGGMPGLRGSAGQGKGGAIFAKPNVLFQIYNTTFQENYALDSSESGFISGILSDTADVYGAATALEPTPTPTATPTITPTPTVTPTATPTPNPVVVVTTLDDENDGPFQGRGVSLREAIDWVFSGGEIAFAESILPGTMTIDPNLGQFVITKTIKIIGSEKYLLTINGNDKRIFMVKEGNLRLENIALMNGLAKGGDGASGPTAGGGGAGLGGGIFINSHASFCGVRVSFQNCAAKGGRGGVSTFCLDDFPEIDREDKLLLLNPTGGGGGFGGDASGPNGGTGWPLVDGNGGQGIKYYSSTKVGGNGGFGGGGAGTYKENSGTGGFGGGSGVCLVTWSYGSTSFWLDKDNPGGAFGGNSHASQAGGGAGLGGAIFVREEGFLYLDRCSFIQNIAATEGYQEGLSKGGAIFVMDKATAKVRDCTFGENIALNAIDRAGFTYYMQSDTHDVYGVIYDLTDGDVSAFPSVDATPTPYATPTPEIQPTPTPQPESIRYEFSGTSVDENGVTLQGAGFGAYPQADVSFGYLPTDNAFEGATDGQGLIVTADSGEGVMIFGSPIEDTRSALIRCSVRTDQAHADVTIASIGNAPGRFIAVNYPEDESYFNGRYMRLQTFCVPPSIGIQPLIQIVNTSQTETLTAYIDNLEVHFIDPYKYYSGAFLDGDEIDPPAEMIALPVQTEAMGLDTSISITASPHPGSNTKIDVSWNPSAYGWYDFIALQITTDSTLQTWNDMYRMFGSIAAYNYTIDGLKPDTVYYVRLVIVNLWSRRDSSVVMVRTNP